MPEYLGQSLITDLSGTPFESFGPIEWSKYYIDRFGHIDGEHHKYWVLKQVYLILTGTTPIVLLAKWADGYTEYRVYTEDKRLDEKYSDAIAP